MSHFRLIFHALWHNVSDSGFRNFFYMCFVSISNIFLHLQTASDYGHHSFGELARFIYGLHQTIKQGSSLRLVEQWEEYVQANHSKFPLKGDEKFLSGTRELAALNKIGSS